MRVAVCDDHAMFADALADALRRLGHVVVGTADTLDEVVDLVARELPEICLLDLWFDGLPSLGAAGRIRVEHPEVRVVLLTADPAPEAVAALDAGVIQAIVGKHWSLALVVQTLARVAAGRHVRRLVPLRAEGAEPVAPHLTAREQEVLALLATGASTTEMREHLDVSEHTVRTHVRSLMSKLGVHSRVEALRVAHDRGLVQTRTAGR
jgi:two-component system, NarL family, nitrate/nitrite response regulator NarL